MEEFFIWYIRLVGTAIAGLGFWLVIRRLQAVWGRERTIATIADYEYGPPDEFGQKAAEMPVFEFTYRGQPCRIRSTVGYDRERHPVGSDIEIGFPQEKPLLAQPVHALRHKLAPYTILFFGIVIVIWGFGLG